LRVLVAGWFSIEGGGATAGDVLVRDIVCAWLGERGIAHDVAQERAIGEGVDWFRVAPTRYTHLVFACGPVGPELAVAELIERFSGCRRAAVNVTLMGDPGWRPFDLVLERDGNGRTRPDLAITHAGAGAPVVALVRVHHQPEYDGARPQLAHAAFDRLLASREAAPVEVDTVLDPAVPGRRTAGEVQALLGRADVVLTTRLHGLVLALAQGVPAVAVDPIVGGAKVSSQARALGWPALLAVEDLSDESLAQQFEWCLTGVARERARATAGGALPVAAEVERVLGAHLSRR
jgi:hypothetical protein